VHLEKKGKQHKIYSHHSSRFSLPFFQLFLMGGMEMKDTVKERVFNQLLFPFFSDNNK